MQILDIDLAIDRHTRWRRQFFTAFAGAAYADMPLSEHRACELPATLAAWANAHPASALACQRALDHDRRFHQLADEIIELSHNGLSEDADHLLPELGETAYRLFMALDALRATPPD